MDLQDVTPIPIGGASPLDDGMTSRSSDSISRSSSGEFEGHQVKYEEPPMEEDRPLSSLTDLEMRSPILSENVDRSLTSSPDSQKELRASHPALTHYDPFYPARFTNTVVSETAVHAALSLFHLQDDATLAAGLLGNIVEAIATSPYFWDKAETLLLSPSHRDTAKNLDEVVRKFIDPEYFLYYTIVLPALGATKIPEAIAFILASGFMKKGASLLLESEACQGSLQQRAEALAPTNSVLEPSLRALVEVMKKQAPNLVASLVRSGIINLHRHHKGEIEQADILHEALLSTTIFLGATFLYYLFYRTFEQIGMKSGGIYQEAAQTDQKKVQQLKTDLETFHPPVHTNSQEDSTVPQSEREALVARPTRAASRIAHARAQDFAKNFEFLKSPLVNLFKDPIYRSFIELTYRYRKDPDSQNAIEAFHALDATHLLSEVMASFDGNAIEEEQVNAYKTLLRHLGVEIPSGKLSPATIQDAQERGFDALIKMFQTHASSPGADRQKAPLLPITSDPRYGAIENLDDPLDDKV